MKLERFTFDNMHGITSHDSGGYIIYSDFIEFLKGYVECIEVDNQTMKTVGRTEVAKGLRRSKMLLNECLEDYGINEKIK